MFPFWAELTSCTRINGMSLLVSLIFLCVRATEIVFSSYIKLCLTLSVEKICGMLRITVLNVFICLNVWFSWQASSNILVFATKYFICVCVCWISSLHTICDICSEITIGGTIWVLTVFGCVLVSFVDVTRGLYDEMPPLFLSLSWRWCGPIVGIFVWECCFRLILLCARHTLELSAVPSHIDRASISCVG